MRSNTADAPQRFKSYVRLYVKPANFWQVRSFELKPQGEKLPLQKKPLGRSGTGILRSKRHQVRADVSP
jgi:hypothetical protein